MQNISDDVIGKRIGPCAFSYTWRDVVLYALAVGAKESESEYLYGENLKVVPSFSALPYFGTFGISPAITIPRPVYMDLGLNLNGGLHMAHEVIIHKPVLSTGAKLTFSDVVTNVYDRGNEKGIVVRTELTACDEQGYKVFTNIGDIFNPNYAMPGADTPPKSDVVWPERNPDYIEKGYVSDTQNYLYGLTGDINRIHIDGKVASQHGFKKPIMQGLCAYGFACRMAVNAFSFKRPENVTRFGASFRAPLYPDTEIELRAWQVTERKAYFKLMDLSTNKPTLDYGVIEWLSL